MFAKPESVQIQNFYLLDPNPTKSLPMIIIGIFTAVAINIHPAMVGIAASFNMFNLPIASIIKPPTIALNGVIITITLAETQNY